MLLERTDRNGDDKGVRDETRMGYSQFLNRPTLMMVRPGMYSEPVRLENWMEDSISTKQSRFTCLVLFHSVSSSC